MPRKARLDAPGTLHHVIVRGIEKRKIVNDDRDREDFLTRLGIIASETETPIYAWALMYNHAHILMRSGPLGLSHFMRRLLSGYATAYNRRHRRHGHLFQNRYKSIVCEEDSYFKELVRYIHLNPVRAKQVISLNELTRHRWCGHGVIAGRIKNDWQDRGYVLKWFGKKEGEARKVYLDFIKKGANQGRRSELVGGGLIRSGGGWMAVSALRRSGIREKSDERILGSGKFVEELIAHSDTIRKNQFSPLQQSEKASKLVEKICKDKKISLNALKSGSRREAVSKVRSQLTKLLVNKHGLSLAETGRQLGVSTSAIAKSIKRQNFIKSN